MSDGNSPAGGGARASTDRGRPLLGDDEAPPPAAVRERSRENDADGPNLELPDWKALPHDGRHSIHDPEIEDEDAKDTDEREVGIVMETKEWGEGISDSDDTSSDEAERRRKVAAKKKVKGRTSQSSARKSAVGDDIEVGIVKVSGEWKGMAGISDSDDSSDDDKKQKEEQERKKREKKKGKKAQIAEPEDSSGDEQIGHRNKGAAKRKPAPAPKQAFGLRHIRFGVISMLGIADFGLQFWCMCIYFRYQMRTWIPLLIIQVVGALLSIYITYHDADVLGFLEKREYSKCDILLVGFLLGCCKGIQVKRAWGRQLSAAEITDEWGDGEDTQAPKSLGAFGGAERAIPVALLTNVPFLLFNAVAFLTAKWIWYEIERNVLAAASLVAMANVTLGIIEVDLSVSSYVFKRYHLDWNATGTRAGRLQVLYPMFHIVFRFSEVILRVLFFTYMWQVLESVGKQWTVFAFGIDYLVGLSLLKYYAPLEETLAAHVIMGMLTLISDLTHFVDQPNFTVPAQTISRYLTTWRLSTMAILVGVAWVRETLFDQCKQTREVTCDLMKSKNICNKEPTREVDRCFWKNSLCEPLITDCVQQTEESLCIPHSMHVVRRCIWVPAQTPICQKECDVFEARGWIFEMNIVAIAFATYVCMRFSRPIRRIGDDLHTVARDGNVARTKKLLAPDKYNQVLDVNAFTKDGRKMTAAMYASLNGNREVLDLLMQEGADYDKQNYDGDTCLHMAAGCDTPGHVDVIEYLLGKGARPDIRNQNGKTAEDMVNPGGFASDAFLKHRQPKSPGKRGSTLKRSSTIGDEADCGAVPLVACGSVLLKGLFPDAEQNDAPSPRALQSVSGLVFSRAAGLLARRVLAKNDESAGAVPLGALRKIGTLGVGGFGTVIEVELPQQKLGGLWNGRQPNRRFALKLQSKKGHQASAFSEVLALRTVQHRFIVRLERAFQTDQFFALLLELCPTDLNRIMIDMTVDGSRCTGLGEERTARYLGQTLLALKHLHEMEGGGIVYRDFKPENVLVSQEDEAKLTDFGLAKTVGKEERMTMCGTMGFFPPELLDCDLLEEIAESFVGGDNQLDDQGTSSLSARQRTETASGSSYDPFKLDSYSFGVSMQVVLLGEDGAQKKEIRKKGFMMLPMHISEEENLEMLRTMNANGGLSDAALDLLQNYLLPFKPSKRSKLAVKAVVDHDFFHNALGCEDTKDYLFNWLKNKDKPKSPSPKAAKVLEKKEAGELTMMASHSVP